VARLAVAKGRAVSVETPERDKPADAGVTPEPQHDGRPHHVTTWPVGLGIAATVGGSVSFAVCFIVGASNAWLGGTLALALLGLGLALAFWGRDLADDAVIAGRYPVPPDSVDGQAELATQLEEHASVITRRSFLSKALVFGIAVFALSQVVLLGALGPWPGSSLTSTGWRKGRRLVTEDGEPIDSRTALATGGFIVAFPEGGEDKANSQVVLLHFVNGDFVPQPGRESWSPEEFVAYSRVRTHAGCPVAEYLDVEQLLVCPCHQSEFDVLHGASVNGGPAGRPLPQLPLAIDADGFLVAQSDFTEDVGPGFWNAS
jgi:ubiquinol-cytochrome c reductase iron-sulfur subunit